MLLHDSLDGCVSTKLELVDACPRPINMNANLVSPLSKKQSALAGGDPPKMYGRLQDNLQARHRPTFNVEEASVVMLLPIILASRDVIFYT